MASIQALDRKVALQLSPGTGVSSLGDFVRELVENSVDAGATAIDFRVLVTDHITVICKDNGAGVPPCQMKELGKLHYTSKFTGDDITQLIELQTRGFRGEALHSMLSNSARATVISRNKGFRSCFRAEYAGNELEQSPVPCEDSFQGGSGSIFSLMDINARPVTNTDRTEILLNAIDTELRNVAFDLAVCTPNVQIRMTVHAATATKLIDTGLTPREFPDRVQAAFENVYEMVLQTQTYSSTCKDIELGVVFSSTPVLTRTHQHVFINGRPHSNPELLARINAELRGGITGKSVASNAPAPPRSSNLLFVIAITYRPEVSELIQCPTTKIINTQTAAVIQTMALEITHAFLEHHTKLKTIEQNTPLLPPKKAEQELCLRSQARAKSLREIARVMHCKPYMSKRFTSDLKCEQTKVSSVSHSPSSRIGSTTAAWPLTESASYELVNQIDKKFILIRIKSAPKPNLYLVDQHAADERVKLESYLEEFLEEVIHNHSRFLEDSLLETELPLPLTGPEHDLVSSFSYDFETWGITFGACSVKSLPPILRAQVGTDTPALKHCILQHARDILEHRKLQVSPGTDWLHAAGSTPEFILDLIRSKACRKALMHGDSLTPRQCIELIERLRKCRFPFQCAHGRPSLVPLTTL